MSGATRGLPRTPPQISAPNDNPDDLVLKEWPRFSFDACPGILGEFVRLATRDSEADPAAVCITALVRFGAEVYGYAPDKGPHLYVGETVQTRRGHGRRRAARILFLHGVKSLQGEAMYMKVFPHGQGAGDGPTRYLVRLEPGPGQASARGAAWRPGTNSTP